LSDSDRPKLGDNVMAGERAPIPESREPLAPHLMDHEFVQWVADARSTVRSSAQWFADPTYLRSRWRLREIYTRLVLEWRKVYHLLGPNDRPEL
jgi:hypothetical protein